MATGGHSDAAARRCGDPPRARVDGRAATPHATTGGPCRSGGFVRGWQPLAAARRGSAGRGTAVRLGRWARCLRGRGRRGRRRRMSEYVGTHSASVCGRKKKKRPLGVWTWEGGEAGNGGVPRRTATGKRQGRSDRTAARPNAVARLAQTSQPRQPDVDRRLTGRAPTADRRCPPHDGSAVPSPPGIRPALAPAGGGRSGSARHAASRGGGRRCRQRPRARAPRRRRGRPCPPFAPWRRVPRRTVGDARPSSPRPYGTARRRHDVAAAHTPDQPTHLFHSCCRVFFLLLS